MGISFGIERESRSIPNFLRVGVSPIDTLENQSNDCCMPKRSSTRQEVNQRAKSVVDQATGQSMTDDGKNAAAVALGRLGGLKGGKARAKKLSKAERTEIARKAAKARWKNR